MSYHSLYSTWSVADMPIAEVSSATATSISLSWSVPSGSVESYVVTWERDTSGECHVENRGNKNIMDGYFSYTIEQLEEDSNYTIILAALNAAGSAVSDPVTGLTREAGEGLTEIIAMDEILCFRSSSSGCSYFCPNIQCDLLQHHCPVGGSGLHPPEWEYNRLFISLLGTEK